MKGKRSVPNILLAAVLLAALILPAAATVGAQATDYIVDSGDGCDALMLVPGLAAMSRTGDLCQLAGTVPAGTSITFQGGWALATPAPWWGPGFSGLALVNEGVINVNGVSPLGLGYNGLGHLDNKGTINFTTPVAIADTGTIHNYAGATMTFAPTATFTNSGALCNSGTLTGVDPAPACAPANPTPVLTGITPNAVPVDPDTNPVIVLSGTSFGPGSQVWMSKPGYGTGSALTSYTDGRLTARLSNSLLTTSGTWQIWVANLDGGSSESLPLTVTPPYVVNSVDSCSALGQLDGLSASIGRAFDGVGGICILAGTLPAGTIVTLEGDWALGTQAPTPGYPGPALVNEGVINVNGAVTTGTGPAGYVGMGHLDNKGAITFSTPVAIASTGTIHNYAAGTMSIAGGFTILDGTICNNGTMSGLDSLPDTCAPGTLDKPAPVLTAITPDSVQAGTPGGLGMVLSGSNFGPTSQIWFSYPGYGTGPMETTYDETAGQLTTVWSVEGWTEPVTFFVTVSNVDGGRSESLPFTVTPPYVVNSLDSCWALNHQVDGVTVAAANEAAGGVGGMCQLTGTWPKGSTLVLEGAWTLDTPAVTSVSKLILANEGAIYVTGGTPSPAGPVSYLGSGHLDNYGYINFGGKVVTFPSGATHNHEGASIYCRRPRKMDAIHMNSA